MKTNNNILPMVPYNHNKASFLFLHAIAEERCDTRISDFNINWIAQNVRPEVDSTYITF